MSSGTAVDEPPSGTTEGSIKKTKSELFKITDLSLQNGTQLHFPIT